MPASQLTVAGAKAIAVDDPSGDPTRDLLAPAVAIGSNPPAPPLFSLLGPGLVACCFLDPALNRSGTIKTPGRCTSR